MNTLVVIPARYASSRFPGKPLALLQGKPMIWHVWSRATQIKMADKEARPLRVIVATEDNRIAETVSAFGGEVVLTSATHRTGSDRVAEVAALYKDVPLVLNLQGDLPLFSPSVLDRLIQLGEKWIINGETDVVTLKSKIVSEEEIFSPNTVKLVSNNRGDLLYFSRSPIPYLEKKAAFLESSLHFKHYGVYLFHRDFLLKMAQCPEGDLEKAERLEQLRVLESGLRIRAITMTDEEAQSFCEVNVPEDLEKANEILSRRKS